MALGCRLDAIGHHQSACLPASPSAQAVRDQFYIICEGGNLPPPIPNFTDMKFPPAVLGVSRKSTCRVHAGDRGLAVGCSCGPGV